MYINKLLICISGIVIFLAGAIAIELYQASVNTSSIFSKELKKLKGNQNYSSIDKPLKKVSTVNYPLLLQEFDLTKQEFATGAGSIGVFCNKITLLDRTGLLYSFDNGSLEKLFQVDNNFTEFLTKYKFVSSDMMRTHNFTSDANKLYVSYTHYNENAGFSHRISRYSHDCISGKISRDEEVLFELQLTEDQALNTQAAGGALLVENEFLYTSIGFVNEKDWSNPQYHDIKSNSDYGTTVAINLKTLESKTFTRGHRNITSIIKRNKALISVEHAMKGGDEINLLEMGSNYGYPYKSFGTKYSSYIQPYTGKLPTDFTEYRDPLWSFVPSIAPGDSFYLENSIFKRWNDSLLIAGLKSRSVFIGKFSDERIIYMEPIFIGDRVRSLIAHENSIFLLTDNSKIIIMQIDAESIEKDSSSSGLLARSPALQKCVVCHSLEPLTGSSAPHLSGITRRPVASIDYDYTEKFLELENQVWNKDLLIKFIQNPESVVSGTTMPNLGLTLEEAENVYMELSKVK